MAQENVPPAEDGQRILYWGERPRLFLLRIQVDRQNWDDYVSTEIKRQFVELDADHDQQLSTMEAERIRQLAGVERLVLTRAQLTEFDTQPPDGFLSPTEFSRLVKVHICQPFVIQAENDQTVQELPLFDQVDADHNGRLTVAELQQAPQNLRHLDYNEDESIGLSELQPLANPLLMSRPPSSPIDSAIPFASVDRNWSPEKWEVELLSRYAVTDGAGNQTIPTTVFEGLSPTVKMQDSNGDGQLQGQELREACRAIIPTAVLRVGIPLHSNARTEVIVEWQHASLSSRIPRLQTSLLRWSLDGIPIQVQARANQIQLTDVRDFYLQRFAVADSDSSGMLNQGELNRLELGDFQVAEIDDNGNGSIERSELQGLLNRISLGLRTQMVLTVQGAGKSMYSLVDREPDRRLTPRELAAIPAALKEVDVNSDGYIDSHEFSSNYRLIVSLGTPPLFRTTREGATENLDPIVRPPTQGPDWFRKMDRNQDGDLSWSEFLGTRSQFEELDRDGTGLVTAAEVSDRP